MLLTNSILFADDTNMFESSKDIYSLQTVIHQELVLVSSWLKVNQLSLDIWLNMKIVNSYKKLPDIWWQTRFMWPNWYQSRWRTRSTGGKNRNWKLLLTNTLPKDHITCVSGKIAKSVQVWLTKLKLFKLYVSILFIWILLFNRLHLGIAHCLSTHQTKLNVTQHKAIRIITGAKYRLCLRDYSKKKRGEVLG